VSGILKFGPLSAPAFPKLPSTTTWALTETHAATRHQKTPSLCIKVVFIAKDKRTLNPLKLNATSKTFRLAKRIKKRRG
jgi:hypothetical protein